MAIDFDAPDPDPAFWLESAPEEPTQQRAGALGPRVPNGPVTVGTGTTDGDAVGSNHRAIKRSGTSLRSTE